jgi:hypothetical protein
MSQNDRHRWGIWRYCQVGATILIFLIPLAFLEVLLGLAPQVPKIVVVNAAGPAQEPPLGGKIGKEATPGAIYGRTGAVREWVLRQTGGTKESEAAVALGLRWLARQQESDGRWKLEGNFRDRGKPNDIAATAFGLLPFLGNGNTHRPREGNQYQAAVDKGLHFLLRKQDPKSGYFGSHMYAHGLATIALAEAYGLTSDPKLKGPAQLAVNYIVQAQHTAGGWRYEPGQDGDTSVTGWQVMALVTAEMSGLDVPKVTLRKAQQYLNSCCDNGNEGYGYVGVGSTPTMSAVGLLCRQYLQAWGPQNLRLIKGIDNNLKTNPPGTTKNVYFYYYATQVMHHFGGRGWKEWNDKIRDLLVKTQVKDAGRDEGSWSSKGDPHGDAGGRLMITSLNLLTLEVYYRHIPLFFRE